MTCQLRQFAGVLLGMAIVSAHAGSPTVASIDTPTVASINLCADQLVLLLADDEQILTVTALSHDKAGSHFHERARHFTGNDGTTAPVAELTPDVVIAGEFTNRYTLSLLDELGLRVEILPLANSIDDAITNVELVAGWLGKDARGAAIADAMRARKASLVTSASADAGIPDAANPDAGIPVAGIPVAAIYDPNGYTVGLKSVRGDILQLAGFRNAATLRGIESYGRLSLETMLSLRPDFLIESPYSAGTFSRAQQIGTHPALRHLEPAPTVVSVPSRDVMCAGPWSLDVVQTLIDARLAWKAQ